MEDEVYQPVNYAIEVSSGKGKIARERKNDTRGIDVRGNKCY
jgi:hypothetical protein